MKLALAELTFLRELFCPSPHHLAVLHDYLTLFRHPEDHLSQHYYDLAWTRALLGCLIAYYIPAIFPCSPA